MDWFWVFYILTIILGILIARKRKRWVAVPLCVMLPFLGFLVAVMLRKRCSYCAEYTYPSAKVCPYCRNKI